MKGGMKRPRRGDGQRMNEEINSAQVRLIDEEGNMAGVMTGREAYEIAQNKGLDLIEVAPNAKPPTCKIMDYGKFKYENKKKEKSAKKKQSVVVIKEIQVRPRTDEHDLNVKMKHARRFLLEGDKVKVNLRFMGREMAHQEVGLKLLRRVIEILNDVANVETPPKTEGRHMFVLLVPDPAKVKDYKKANSSKEPGESSGKAEAKKAAEGTDSEQPADKVNSKKSVAKVQPKADTES